MSKKSRRKISKLLFYALLVFVGILMYNTFTFNSLQIKVEPVALLPLAQGFESSLQEAIKIPTTSHHTHIDTAAFLDFNQFLTLQFPLADSMLEKEIVGGFSHVYRWPGRNPMLKPILLIAHIDVVPVEAESLEKWAFPPYSGTVKEGFVWGRGSMDDKMSVIGILEAAELLLKKGYQPERPVYFAFGHDEEVSGKNGALRIIEHFDKQDITFEFVLDEGLAIVEKIMPGVEPPLALIGLAEKGFLTLELTATQEGGHSSMPPPQTTIGVLSAAITKLEANPLPASISGPTRELFECVGPEMSFPYKMIMANLWAFEGVLKRILSKKNTTNAIIRSTTAFTMIEGGVQDNVLPTQASAKVNFRLLPGHTPEQVIQQVKDRINDERITIASLNDWDAKTKVSDSQAFGFQIIKRSIKETFPEAIVAPALVMATTDSRHYESISENTYRFLPIRLKGKDTERIHGIDERISIDNYRECINFYYRLILNASS